MCRCCPKLTGLIMCANNGVYAVLHIHLVSRDMFKPFGKAKRIFNLIKQ